MKKLTISQSRLENQELLMVHKFRLNQKGESNFWFLLFLVIFVLLIASVPVVDLIRDLKEDKPVQSIQIFKDTFIQPLIRRDSLVSQLEGLVQKSQVIRKNFENNLANPEIPQDSLLKLSEEIYFELGDLILTLKEINPYVKLDSTSQIFESSNKLKSSWKTAVEKDALAWTQSLEIHWLKFISLVESENQVAPKLWYNAFFTHTIFNPKYLRAFETEMEDESVIAKASRKVMQKVYANLFSEYGDKAIRGEEDANSHEWLFYKPGVNYLVKPSVLDPRSQKVDANDQAVLENPIEVIREFRDRLQDRGIELLVMIVPTKGSIYPELLNSDYEGQGELGSSLEMIRQLNQYGIHTLDLFKVLGDAKSKIYESKTSEASGPTSTEYLYLNQDTHWSPQALGPVAKALASKIKDMKWYTPKPKSFEYITQDTIVERMGDIAEMTEIENYFPSQKVRAQQVFKISRDSLGEIQSKHLYRDDHRKARILYLGDSFSRIYQTDTPTSAGIISHLAKELGEDLSSIVSDGGASTLVREKLARKKKLLKKKKLVIWEFVERDFRYGAEGWKKVDL